MMTDQHNAGSPAGRIAASRSDVAVRATITLAFTGVQAWAMVLVVLHVELGGAARLALAAALAAAVITVLDAWRDVWTPARPGARHRRLS
jgi:hypothetical protein